MKSSTEATIQGLLDGLNEPQREAATHTDGPLLILAGPGSGKTRVVTRRAACLACTTTDPWHILAITFTNKAAKEMRERVDGLEVAGGMTVCTFHALCARLLREFHDRAGIARNFTIFDRDDRRKLIKKAIEEAGYDTTNWKPAAIDAEISRAKNAMMTCTAYASAAADWQQETIAKIYPFYEKMLSDMHALDFDDLLMRIASLLADDDELRDQLSDRYRYVLVDEYQDTNASQYQITRLLTQEHQNLCATGDPDQSIYGWRGADIGNILNFERDYPEARVVRLEQNYRSTKRILSAADALIEKNVNRKEKKLWTQNAEGASVRMIESETDADEAATIAQDMAARQREGVRLDDMAVFYRVNSLSRVLEEAMLRTSLPYQIARGLEFYNRKEIKDVLAYLRVLVNSADEIALARIINTPPRGIGAKTVERLVERAKAGGRSIYDVLMDESLADLGRSGTKVAAFASLLRHLAQALAQPAKDALEFIISHSGLRAHYRAMQGVDDAPINNIDELVSAAAEYQLEQPDATLVDWLEHTALVSDVDAVKSETGCVTLMTLHAAKGLEFAQVYLIGLEQGLLPFHRNGDVCDDEEERRLLFVGMTRAKERLTLSRARYRMRRGVTERTARSSFLDELPHDQLEWKAFDAPSSRRKRPVVADRGLPDDIELWEVGTIVKHPQHDLGRIVTLERGRTRTIVDVEFVGGVRKSWMLEYAPLTRMDPDEMDDVHEFVAD